MSDEQKPSTEELQHFGIPGMRWGRKKAQPPPTTIQSQARHIARRDAGIIATRAVLKNYGDRIPGASLKAAKGGIGLLKYSGRVAHGSVVALRLLGRSVKLVGRGGKAYVKGAIGIAKVLR